jgi:hypothetical protein
LLSPDELTTLRSMFRPGNSDDNFLYRVEIETCRDGGRWSRPVRVWLWYHDDREEFEYVGLEHVD